MYFQPELIAKYGYPVQSHSVQTEEGYILELHRIPHGRLEATVTPRPAVLIHHAFLCSSFDWVVLGPDKSLGTSFISPLFEPSCVYLLPSPRPNVRKILALYLASTYRRVWLTFLMGFLSLSRKILG
jgi:hypothetical protein